MAQRAATGISDRPMAVMTEPVTSGGKKRMMRENTGVMSRPMTDAAITAPNTVGSPPPALRMATMVATLANDTPCTRGSLQPKNGTPSVCSMVARPPMNRHEAINMPISLEGRPAAWPMMSGTAMMPPYMVRTCWKP